MSTIRYREKLNKGPLALNFLKHSWRNHSHSVLNNIKDSILQKFSQTVFNFGKKCIPKSAFTQNWWTVLSTSFQIRGADLSDFVFFNRIRETVYFFGWSKVSVLVSSPFSVWLLWLIWTSWKMTSWKNTGTNRNISVFLIDRKYTTHTYRILMDRRKKKISNLISQKTISHPNRSKKYRHLFLFFYTPLDNDQHPNYRLRSFVRPYLWPKEKNASFFEKPNYNFTLKSVYIHFWPFLI